MSSDCIFSDITNSMNANLICDDYRTSNGKLLPKNLSYALLNSEHCNDIIHFVSNNVWYEYKLNDKILSEYELVSDENGNLYHKKGDLVKAYKITRIHNGNRKPE